MKDKTQKELQAIMEAGYQARNELQQREADARDRRNSELVGRTFRYRNSFGSGSEPWWLYGKVTGTKDGHVSMFRFQTDSHGRIEVEPDYLNLGDRLESWHEIPKQEFDAEWDATLQRIHRYASPSPEPQSDEQA